MNIHSASSARPAVCLTGLLCLAATSSLHAQTWDSGGANNNWSTGGNWSANIAPVNNGTANVSFGSGARTTSIIDVPWNVNSLTFTVGSPTFVFGGSTLTIQGGGVLNTSIADQSIVVDAQMGAPQTWNAFLGEISFQSGVANNGHLLTVDGANNTSIRGPISGGGGLTKNGSGTLILSEYSSAAGGSTFTGVTTVNAGMMVLNRPTVNDSTITGNLVIGDGSGGVNADIVRLDEDYQIKDTSAVTINSSGLLNLNGFIDDFGSLTMNGGNITTGAAGTLRLFGNVMAVSTSGSTPTITGNLNLGGTTKNFAVNVGPAALDLSIPANITNGTMTKSGAGYMLLSGNNNFAGGLTLNDGRLHVGSNTAAGTGTLTLNAGMLLGDTAPRTLANAVTLGGDVAFAGTDLTLTGAATLTGDRTLSVQNASALSGALGESGLFRRLTLSSSSSGTLTLNGSSANTFSGATTVNGGTLLLAKTGGALAIGTTLNIGDGAPGFSDVVRLGASAQISGPAWITMLSSGLLDLNGFNQSVAQLDMTSGSITTGAGTLAVGGEIYTRSHASAAGIAGRVAVGSAPALSIYTQNGAALNDLDITADISGGGAGIILEKNGDGRLRLSGNSSFTGTVRLQSGTLAVGSNTALGNAALQLLGGDLMGDGNRTLANPTTLAANTTMPFGGSLTFSGPFSATGTVSLFNSSPLTLSGAVTLPAGNSWTKREGGSFTLSAPTTLAGDFTLGTGPMTATNLTIGSTGSYTQGIANLITSPAPNFDGTLTSKGAFTWNSTGGEFSGRLINEGTTTFNADFFARNGIANYSTMTVGTGRTIFTGGAGLDNQGTIVMAGGTLYGSNLFVNSPLDNHGFMTGFGTVSGPVSFTNYGQVSVTGNLTLNTTLSYNSGNVDVSAGAQFRLTGNSLFNTGSLNLAGGSITGTAQIINGTGGTIGGRGQISAPLFNASGAVVPQTGTLSVPGGIYNGGTILLPAAGTLNAGGPITNIGTITAAGGTLTGTGAIANSGIIQGAGTITNTISSFTGSRIEPVAGVLTLTGAVNNVAGATISTTTGNKLLLSAGLAINAGKLDLAGGIFDNNGHQLQNPGNITGYGTLRTGGLYNDGGILFSGGSTTIAGDVVNLGTGFIEVRNTPALFTGNVTNNGIFKNTDATITFAGNYLENGAYISDPADNFFANLSVGPNGIITGGHGDRFFIAGNLISFSNRNEAWETRAAELTFDGVSAAFHEFSIGGADFGKTDDGYAGNFAWDTVSVAIGDYLILTDAGAPGGALYTQVFALGGGLAQLPSVTGNGVNIYYHPARAENAWLHGGTYPLNGGGILAPVPEPGTAALASLTVLTLLRRRRK